MPDASGRLLVCATPIGNLGDVTLRVLDALGSVDAILAEDTRVTSKLLARHAIETRLERYDEHTAARRTPRFVERMIAGERFALVSDAGTPGVSDPGATLVDAALIAGVPVEVLPGPSAILTALVASGLPTDAFYFGGFLPRKAGDRERLFASLASLDATLVFYESPHRAASALASLASAFPERDAAMARELTKLHEEVVRGPLPELAAAIGERASLKGEVVLVIAPPAAGESTVDLTDDEIAEEVRRLVGGGMRRTEAVRSVAQRAGVPRHRVYEIAHRGDGPAL